MRLRPNITRRRVGDVEEEGRGTVLDRDENIPKYALPGNVRLRGSGVDVDIRRNLWGVTVGYCTKWIDARCHIVLHDAHATVC